MKILIDLLLFCEPHLDSEATGRTVTVRARLIQAAPLYLGSFCVVETSEERFPVSTFHKICFTHLVSRLSKIKFHLILSMESHVVI